MADILTSSLTDRVKAKLAFTKNSFNTTKDSNTTFGDTVDWAYEKCLDGPHIDGPQPSKASALTTATWAGIGAEHENARLQPLLTQLLEIVQHAKDYLETGSQGAADCLEEELTALEKYL